MLKIIERNGKLKYAIFVSITLHCVLIIIFIWSSIQQPQMTNLNNKGSSIAAIMLDSDNMIQPHKHYKYKTDEQQISQQNLIADQTKKIKIETTLQKKPEVIPKQKTEKQNNQVISDTKKHMKEKIQISSLSKDDKQVNTKIKIEKDTLVKQKADFSNKKSNEIDELLNGLTNIRNMPKSIDTSIKSTNNQLNSNTELEVNNYLARVHQAISNKFYDASNYKGKNCILKIKLSPDGVLITVVSDGGDSTLCQAAISAAKLAAIPRSPNPQVYELIKNITIDFKP